MNLEFNNIGVEGAQHLANALRVNTVRLNFSPSHIATIIVNSNRHSQRWIWQATISALKEHSFWQVRCKWTQWDSTPLHLISQLSSSFHTDTYNAGTWSKSHRRWRSTAFGKCIAGELSKPWLLSILYLSPHLHFTQTITTLNLYANNIGTKGVQYLANALQMNIVRLDFSPSHIATIIVNSNRHLQRWTWQATTSVLKQSNIWQLHCKWTQWGSTSL